jgi:Fe-S-cluster containining protein
MFIHIRPEEEQTLEHIPRALLFPAPGLPKGHVLMGYGDNGQCPMLVGDECSIYEYRPQTCRDYDCRIFAATGVAVDEQTQDEIARRVKAWVFHYESEASREEHMILKEAAGFLQSNRDLFPPGSLPNYPVQLAAVAVRVYRLFSELKTKMHDDNSVMADAAIARAVMSALTTRAAPPADRRAWPSGRVNNRRGARRPTASVPPQRH